MDYLNSVNDNYPIRRKENDKKAFRDFVMGEAERCNKKARVETPGKNHNNVIIGDIEKADVIITAHYDTPAASVIPNLMLPKNIGLSYLYHFGYPIMLALLSLAIAFGISELLSLAYEAWAALYLVIYLGSFWLCSRTFVNKHNKNDNTSGVAALLTVMSHVQSGRAAFVLFDNEEKGLLGSKAFNKAHKELMEKKLVVNLDCVGLGDNIIVISKDAAKELPLYSLLTEALASGDGFSVIHFSAKEARSNSDQKNFKCGVGVMACKKAKGVGYYTSRIHTGRDTLADVKNIEFLASRLTEFCERRTAE